MITADLHSLKLFAGFWVSDLSALPTEGGDVTNEEGAVLTEAKTHHAAALQPPASRLPRLRPAGLPVVTRGRQAPRETRGEVTERRPCKTE